MPTEQIDWVELYMRQERIRFAELRKMKAMAWAEVQHLAMQRRHWLKVPVSNRPRRAINVFARYHAAKANLRRLKRLAMKAGVSGPEVKK